jgi:hypothetical protein
VLDEVMEDADDKIRLAAAKDVLDRTGHGAVRKSEVNLSVTSGGVDVDAEIERRLSGGLDIVQEDIEDEEQAALPAPVSIDDALDALSFTHQDDTPTSSGMPGIPLKRARE